ncbi:hypothetical protein [Sphingobium nicotianae]|uniref:Uncharacterized protein n=1 Tax=Sphingobium nicotianae TaxID=2782607 RepID=A0A9X1IR95_9SPHN|nr:hypothetical protein [Sphingobium nicotianae]MBT2187212.1 hypothetical protein [Sphingobium nicotianae]
MSIFSVRVIVPDTSHWAKWIDAALSSTSPDHAAAIGLYTAMISAGRIPLLSWHHLEELLAIEDEHWARRRIAYIQALPLVAYPKFSPDGAHPGSVVDVLSSEVAAVLEGARSLEQIRDSARTRLIKTGPGVQAIGSEAWVWDVLRTEFIERRDNAKLIAATKRIPLFDESRTVGEISKGSIRSLNEQAIMFAQLRGQISDHIQNRGDREISDPAAMAGDFMADVLKLAVPEGLTVRRLLEIALTAQGIDVTEIRDDIVLSELNELGVFRQRLEIVADNIGVPFAQLKATIDMRMLPSWQTQRALAKFGQERIRSSGSDVVDGSLAALAPYVAELFVDKRTAEDFKQLGTRAGPVTGLFGRIRRTSRFTDLLRSENDESK